MWATHQFQILVKEKVISSLKYVDFQDVFKKITILNGNMRAKFKYCSNLYIFQKGIVMVNRHLKDKHPEKYGIDLSQHNC